MAPVPLWILTLLSATTPLADPPPTAAPADTSLPTKLEFPLEGYRINTLDISTRPLPNFTMSLPVAGPGAWPQVRVTIYPPMKGTPMWKNFTADAENFYAKPGDTVLFERLRSPTELQVEFTATNGHLTGPKEHSYVRMFVVNGTCYEVRATAPDPQWPAVASQLKACVESFELSPDPAPGKVAFPHQGFRISPLDGSVPAGMRQLLLSMPGTVRVSVEPYSKTLKDYQAERKPPEMWDSKHKFKILSESSPAENALVTEYAEELAPPGKNNPQGIQALSYEKVVLAHGQLYFATDTLTDPWGRGRLNEVDPELSAQIKTCVESLETIPIPAPASASSK